MSSSAFDALRGKREEEKPPAPDFEISSSTLGKPIDPSDFLVQSYQIGEAEKAFEERMFPHGTDTTLGEKFQHWLKEGFIGKALRGPDPTPEDEAKARNAWEELVREYGEEQARAIGAFKPEVYPVKMGFGQPRYMYPEYMEEKKKREELNMRVATEVAQSGNISKGVYSAAMMSQALAPFSVAGKLMTPVSNYVASKFALPMRAAGMGKAAPYLEMVPEIVRGTTQTAGTFALAGAMMENVEPGATWESVIKRAKEDADLGVILQGAGSIARYPNYANARYLRHIFPFASEVTAFAAWPKVSHGEMVDPADFVTSLVTLLPYKASGVTKESVQRMAKAEIESYFNYGEGATETQYRPARLRKESEVPKKQPQPWDLSFEQFQQQFEIKQGKQGYGVYRKKGSKLYWEVLRERTDMGREYEEIVRDAASEGKKVASDALERFPDLQGKKVERPEPFPETPMELWETFEKLKKDPKLISHFRKFTPEAFRGISDRMWYEVVKRVDPQMAHIIGMKRGVVRIPKRLEELYRRDNLKLRKIGPWSTNEIKERFLGNRPIADIKKGKFTYEELKEINEKMLEDLLSRGPEDPNRIREVVNPDPYGKIRQFYYYPKKGNRKIFEITPVEEKVRLSLMPEPVWPYKGRSPRYALDGTNITPDIDRTMFDITTTLDEVIQAIEKSVRTEKGIKDIDRTIAFIETGKYQEGMNQSEIEFGKLAREILEYYVKHAEVAEAMGLMTATGGIRKMEKYWTALHKFNEKEVDRDVEIFETLPKETIAGQTRKRGKFAIKRRDLERALVTYVYLAERKINLEPTLRRAIERANYLPSKLQHYAAEHIRNVMNVHRDLYPKGWDKVTQEIASRIYVGALGLSPGTPARNLTQLIPATILIGAKHMLEGINQWGYDPKMKQLAIDAKVAGDFRPDYMQEGGAFTTPRRIINRLDDAQLWMFMKSEQFMRESVYLGGRHHLLTNKTKSDMKWMRADMRELITKYMKDGQWMKAADAYGREAAMHSQYAYTKHQAMPWLKTWYGRTAGQFTSFPSYTGEMWVQTILHGDVKKGMAMLAAHPIAIAAGRPLGISFAGFMGLGVLPHLSPLTQWMKSLLEMGAYHKSGNEAAYARALDDFQKMSYLAFPSGRMMRTRALDFYHTMKTRDKDGNFWLYDDNRAKGKKITMKEALIRLMDLQPWGDTKDREVARYIDQKQANNNYRTGKSYIHMKNALFYAGIGNKEKAMQEFEEGQKIWATTYQAIEGQDMDWDTFQKFLEQLNMPKALQAAMRSEKNMHIILQQMPTSMRNDFRDIFDAYLTDMKEGSLDPFDKKLLGQ